MNANSSRAPSRKVVSWTAGSGTDTMKLECGHTALRDHRSQPPRRAYCLDCQAEADAKP